MPVSYEPWLVLLSIVMAIQGAYVGLSLSVQIGDAAGMRRRMLLAGSAFSLAVAIWTMHFVGMLAARLSFPVDYLVFPTLLSFLVCVIVVGVAVYATSSGPLTPLRLTLSACLMGGGIFSMHYLGMSALHASAHMIHAQLFVAASMAVAIAASGLALWLARRTGRAAAAGPVRDRVRHRGVGHALHRDGRASGCSRTSPRHRPRPRSRPICWRSWSRSWRSACRGYSCCSSCRSARPTTASRADAGRGADVPRTRHGSSRVTASPDFGRGAYAAARRRRGPPRRFARHLPVERDGGTQFVAVETSSRSTPTRTTPTSSTETTSCSARSRSATSSSGSTATASSACTAATSSTSSGWSAQRSGDNELVEMEADHYAVPVSRSRVGSLKSRVAASNGAERRRRHHICVAIICSARRARSRIHRVASANLTQFVQSARHSCRNRAFCAAPVASSPSLAAAAHTRRTSRSLRQN